MRLEVVKRPEAKKGFVLLPRRWVVERALAWIGRYRRPSQGDEDLPESRATMIDLAMSRLLRRRLARQAPYGVPSPQRLGLRGFAPAF
jgi:putative transposase